MTSKELREKRATLAVRMREMTDKLHTESRDFSGEEQRSWEEINKDYDLMTRQITLIECVEKAESDQAAPADAPTDEASRSRSRSRIVLPGRDDVDLRSALEDANRGGDEDDELTDAELGINVRSVKPEVFALALQGWMRARSGLDVEERHVKAARQAKLNLRSGNLDINLGDTRSYRSLQREHRAALSATDNSLGASTIAPDFVTSFERSMLAFGGVREVAEVIRTNTGAELTWPTTDDTGNEGELLGENTAASEQGIATGAVTWGAHKFSSKMIKVPVELLEDSAFDLVSVIGEMCGERIARATNRKYTVGTGASQPKGIVNAASLGKTAAGAAAITADEIFDLVHSVDPAYRTGAGFMFHDSTLLAIRKLKSNDSQYIWQPGLTGAEPDRLLGYTYSINQHMATIATGAKTVLFGQLNKYKIRDVRALRFRRLVERYADNDQEGFVAFFRTDGNLLNAGTAPVKYLVQA